MKWVGGWMRGVGVNAQNTLHQTKALLQAGCVSSPFMFLYFPLKDKTKRVRGDKVKKKKQQRAEKGGREWETERKRQERERERVSHLPAFATEAMLGKLRQTRWNAWIIAGAERVKIWLLWGCHCPSLPFAWTARLFP